MRGGWGILSQPGKGRSLGRNGATVFSTVLLRTGIYHLKVVCLARLPFSQSIGQRGMAFLRPLFVCTHCCFWVPVFPALCLGYMEQTKKSRNSLTCHSLHVEVPSQSSFFLFQCSMYILDIMFRVFSCTPWQEQGKVKSTSSSQKKQFILPSLLIATPQIRHQNRKNTELGVQRTGFKFYLTWEFRGILALSLISPIS